MVLLTVFQRDPQYSHLEKTRGEGPVITPRPEFPFNLCYSYKGIKKPCTITSAEAYLSAADRIPMITAVFHASTFLDPCCNTGVTQLSLSFGVFLLRASAQQK